MTKSNLAVVAALIALLAPAGASAAGDWDDTIDVGQRKLTIPSDLPPIARARIAGRAGVAATTLESPPLGTKRFWPVIDDLDPAGFALERMTLTAVGSKIEVWVADDLSFPPGDCRNDGSRNVLTAAQAGYLAGQFDTNIQPKESAAFSSPPSRAGDGGLLEAFGIVPPGYYAGPGDKIVTLVANFKDENYLDITFPSYIAGYHSSGINSFVNRNVMSIDSFDWAHRTGASPAHEPSTVLCQNKTAQPFKYEGVFAHEYQHLLEFWASPGEATWVNEGLSDYAISVTGYGAPRKSVQEIGYDGHIQTFLGWRSLQTPANPIPNLEGGAENSLTWWNDQGGRETLSDYGAAYTFMEFLAGRYGSAFMTALHNEDGNGLSGLQAVLDRYLTGKDTQELVHEWAAMVAVDASLDDGAKLKILAGHESSDDERRGGGKKESLQAPSLNASVNWANPESYSTAGAPPNGSDYVRLRDAAGNPLAPSRIKVIDFVGARTHAPEPLEWTSETIGGNAVLSAGAVDDRDRSIVRAISVPSSGDRTLSFATQYSIEAGWDFAFVQISADDGLTWTSQANASTTEEHDGGALSAHIANLPGLSGDAEWHTEAFDLSAYAGRTVLLRFRMMTDAASLGNGAGIAAGWLIDDVRVGGALVSDGTLTGWTTPAPPIAGYTVQLVGFDTRRNKEVSVASLPLLDGRYGLAFSKPLAKLLGDKATEVGAIVTYDEPSESILRYAPYRLRVNGVVQPGG